MTEQEQDVIKHFQTSEGTRVERIQLGSHHISQKSCTFPGWDTTLEGVSHLGGHCVTEEVGAPFCCPSMGGMTVWAVSAQVWAQMQARAAAVGSVCLQRSVSLRQESTQDTPVPWSPGTCLPTPAG